MRTTLSVLLIGAAAAAASGCGGAGGDASTTRATQSSQKPAIAIPPSQSAPVTLVAGIPYYTSRFRPRVTVTLPHGGWQTGTPETTDSVSFRLLDGPARNAIVSLVRPAAIADPVAGARTAADGKPLPADFITWLQRHPRLAAGEPVAVEVGGLRGRQLDVTVRSAPARRPAECGGKACLPLYFDGKVPVEFAVGDRLRYLELQAPGRSLLVELYVGPGSQFSAVLPRLEAALKGIRLKA
jgi:hypothetical protein